MGLDSLNELINDSNKNYKPSEILEQMKNCCLYFIQTSQIVSTIDESNNNECTKSANPHESFMHQPVLFLAIF